MRRRKNPGIAALCIAVAAALSTPGVLARGAGDAAPSSQSRPARFPGMDQSVNVDLADKAGIPARKPYLNFEEWGDLWNLMLLLGGGVCGFVVGRHWDQIWGKPRSLTKTISGQISGSADEPVESDGRVSGQPYSYRLDRMIEDYQNAGIRDGWHHWDARLKIFLVIVAVALNVIVAEAWLSLALLVISLIFIALSRIPLAAVCRILSRTGMGNILCIRGIFDRFRHRAALVDRTDRRLSRRRQPRDQRCASGRLGDVLDRHLYVDDAVPASVGRTEILSGPRGSD